MALSVSIFPLKPELFRSDTAVLTEAAYEMAAIREAGMTAYEVQIMICEHEVFFRFEYPHAADILLAAHSVKLTEACSKAGIAEVAFLGDVTYLDVVFKVCVDVLCDVLDAE